MNRKNQVHSAERAASEEWLEFEKFLADLSARFVTLPPNRVDDEIRNALKKVFEFFRFNRVSLLQLLPGKTLFQIVNSADPNGFSP